MIFTSIDNLFPRPSFASVYVVGHYQEALVRKSSNQLHLIEELPNVSLAVRPGM